MFGLVGGGIALPSVLNWCFSQKEPEHNFKNTFSQLTVTGRIYSLACSEIVCLLHCGLILHRLEKLNFFQYDGIGDRIHFE